MGWYAAYVFVFYPRLSPAQLAIVKQWIIDTLLAEEFEDRKPEERNVDDWITINNTTHQTEITLPELKYGSPPSDFKGKLYLLLLDEQMPEGLNGYVEWKRDGGAEKQEEAKFEEFNGAMKKTYERNPLDIEDRQEEKISFDGTELIIDETPVLINGKKYYIERTERLVLAD